MPTAASAAALTLGSSLTPGPTSFGCETEPFIGFSGGYEAGPSGDPGCTWWQSGVFNVPNDPRTGSVPFTGTVTKVEVLGGANPSPIRIAVFRMLSAAGNSSECCFFIQETPPLQPLPNTPTAFPVNLHVAHASAVGGIRADDFVGISAQTGGTAPLRVVGDPNATFTTGSVNAGFYYPRFGSVPGDAYPGGGRRDPGIGGIEVLMRWTICADGDGTCGPAPNAISGGTPTPGTGGAGLANQLARIRRGSALIKLACGGNQLCEGQLELLNPGAIAAAKKKKVTIYGKKSYQIPAGGKATLKVKLNKKGKRLLRKKRRAKVGIRLTPKGGAATTAKLTLKR